MNIHKRDQLSSFFSSPKPDFGGGVNVVALVAVLV